MAARAGPARWRQISIAQVAMDLGYGSASAFTAAFHRVLGAAPSRYLASHERAARIGAAG
jgi:AraC-like DNA-binding protein